MRQQTITDAATSSGSFCFLAAAEVSDITITVADAVLAMTTVSGSSYCSSAAAAGAAMAAASAAKLQTGG